ncbi:COCA1-like protein [Mya arenaria]|uniref:COCA1-like protein n=1 Tax=Mya arenaria TaxID=6604 RepID=A0ABY7FR69_MYAAR|nr:COCA1-like protein [Mya arenaria]
MVHMERMMLHVLWVSAVWAVGARGFLFRRTDCQVSAWSPWSEPFGFGQVSRERAILRHPDNGGTICPPELEQIKITVHCDIHRNEFYGPELANSLSEARLRDLLVIVDGSGSIGPTNFNDAKYQLASLLGMLCPTPDPFKVYQRAALIEFSSNVREIFDFNDKANTLSVQQGVKGMPYSGDSTCTATAFNYARNTMFTAVKSMRNLDAKQEALILTDGQSNCGGDAVRVAKLLDVKANVHGIVIGSHNTANIQVLTNYVSSPKNEHLITLKNARELSQLVDLVEQQLKSIRCAPFDM